MNKTKKTKKQKNKKTKKQKNKKNEVSTYTNTILKMVHLHSDVMFTLIQFFDAQCMAKMAQVSKTWKKIVYRSSVWTNFSWKPKEKYRAYFVTESEIPRTARHIGEPNAFCFQAWLQFKVETNIMNDISHQLSNTHDPIAYMKKQWSKLKKPCVCIYHHIWTDVLRGSIFLNTLSQADRQRFYNRIIMQPTYTTNSYRMWLEEHIDKLVSMEFQYNEIPPQINTTNENDVMYVFQLFLQTKKQNLRRCIQEQITTLRHIYKNSHRALLKYGIHEFNSNENQYKRNPKILLDEVAFGSSL